MGDRPRAQTNGNERERTEMYAPGRLLPSRETGSKCLYKSFIHKGCPEIINSGGSNPSPNGAKHSSLALNMQIFGSNANVGSRTFEVEFRGVNLNNSQNKGYFPL